MINQSLIDVISCSISLLSDLINNLQMSSSSRFFLDVFCNVWLSTYAMWALITSSSYNLILLTMERYLAITNPMKFNRQIVLHRLPIVLCTAWLSGNYYEYWENIVGMWNQHSILMRTMYGFVFTLIGGQCSCHIKEQYIWHGLRFEQLNTNNE